LRGLIGTLGVSKRLERSNWNIGMFDKMTERFLGTLGASKITIEKFVIRTGVLYTIG